MSEDLPQNPYCKQAQEKQLTRVRKRLIETPPAPQCKTKTKDGKTIRCLASTVNDDAALLEACGTADYTFAQTLADDLNRTLCFTPGENELNTVNAGLAALAGSTPANELEAMLIAQMIATHKAGMRMLGRAMRAETLEVGQWQSSFAVKLLRTYTMQLEALSRYRGQGQQTVRVEHVTVNAGGQAIVGNVSPTGGGVQQKVEEQPHATTIDYQPAPAMPSMRSKNAERDTMPISGHAER